MKLNLRGIENARPWLDAGVRMPKFDVAQMRGATTHRPIWLHFGAGNIFRGFPAKLQQNLLDSGDALKGIVAAETFDPDIITKVYAPHDDLSIATTLRADGSTENRVIASIAEGIDATTEEGRMRLAQIFECHSLQMVSFTITEKGYALRDLDGNFLPRVQADIEGNPRDAKHLIGMIAWLLLRRFHMCASPIALVSMDNCARNGEKLRAAVLEMCSAWVKLGIAGEHFFRYVLDESMVSFPWTMIDKITPRPSVQVERQLTDLGIEDMEPIVTDKHTYIAPFVNAEGPEYLVIEDAFPNGRPPLERAGAYMTTRDVVNQVERMKVTTCLNPLHTALAVYGCLFGYDSIAGEMRDAQLRRLVEKIGLDEGMPVVTNPGLISPEAFIREVIDERLPNPFIPDTPQRIATDTSQKIGIRFGETIKAYVSDPRLDPASLTGIPLAIAGWLRYLLGVNDQLEPFEISPDPMLEQLRGMLADVSIGDPGSARGKLDSVLGNEALFGCDLRAAGLAGKIEGMFGEMLGGKGAVRSALIRHLGQ